MNKQLLKILFNRYTLGAALLFSALVYFIGFEKVTKQVLDIKADITGTDRVVKIYQKQCGGNQEPIYQKIMKDAQTTIVNDNTITVWNGGENKKMTVQGAIVIVEDK